MIPVGKPLLKLQAEISPTTPVSSEETASSEEAPPSEKNPPDKTPTPEGGFSSEESAAAKSVSFGVSLFGERFRCTANRCR